MESHCKTSKSLLVASLDLQNGRHKQKHPAGTEKTAENWKHEKLIRGVHQPEWQTNCKTSSPEKDQTSTQNKGITKCSSRYKIQVLVYIVRFTLWTSQLFDAALQCAVCGWHLASSSTRFLTSCSAATETFKKLFPRRPCHVTRTEIPQLTVQFASDLCSASSVSWAKDNAIGHCKGARFWKQRQVRVCVCVFVFSWFRNWT